MASSPEIAWLSANELLQAYGRGSLSPVDVLRSLRARCEQINPTVNAFYEFDWRTAEQEARDSERRWGHGVPKGALDGVPVSVKDHLDVRGYSSPRGLFCTDRTPASNDCAAVRHLRAAGAIVFGKTLMPELSVMSVTDSVAFGPSRNPWDLARTSGGSSGGASAAVAAGLGPLALASDGGGSNRHPCGFTGVVGVKPTHGRVPYFPGPTDRTVAGPMSRTVRDAALMLTALARPDGRDWTELPPSEVNYLDELAVPPARLRIAYSPTFGYLKPDVAVEQAVSGMVARLNGLGHRVDLLDFVCDDAREAHLVQAAPRYAKWAARLAPETLERFPPASRGLLHHLRSLTLLDYEEMAEMRNRIATQLLSVFGSYDALVSPVSPMQAPAVGEFYPDGDLVHGRSREIGGYTRPFNLVHMPAVSVPCGYTPEGMPVGMQIAGPKFSEALLLRLAHQVEERFTDAFGGRRPSFRNGSRMPAE